MVANKSKTVIKIVLDIISLYYIREARGNITKERNIKKEEENVEGKREERERQSTSHGFALPSTRPWLNST